MKGTFLLILSSLLLSPVTYAKTVRYEFVAIKAEVNLSGKRSVDLAASVEVQF